MKKSALLLTTILSTSVAFAEKDEHREHGAHEHGHANLSVVAEKNDLLIAIESPALNVFGFEHEPENNEQKAVVKQAIEDLENFNSLVVLDPKAKCSLVKVNVKQPFADDDHKDEHKHDEHDDDHKDEHKDEHKHDEHDDDHKDEHKHDEDKESAHSDIDIDVSYSCKNPSMLKQIDLAPLFKRFPLFVELDAQGIINGQQSAIELSKKQPVFSF